MRLDAAHRSIFFFWFFSVYLRVLRGDKIMLPQSFTKNIAQLCYLMWGTTQCADLGMAINQNSFLLQFLNHLKQTISVFCRFNKLWQFFNQGKKGSIVSFS